MKTLTDLCRTHKTDKGPMFHNYVAHYDLLLPRAARVLEIGVLSGDSLRMWADWVGADGSVDGIDNHAPHVQRFNQDAPKYARAHVLDASDREALRAFADKHGPWDLIVDDGSHEPDHQKTALLALELYLNEGGYYVIEDCEAKGGDFLDELYRYYQLKPADRRRLRPVTRMFPRPVFCVGDSGGWTIVMKKETCRDS